MDIVCLGEMILDMFPTEVGRRLADVTAFRPVPGGAPANVAVAAARLGAKSAFIGKVGDDAFGYRLAAALEQEGVTTQGLRFDPQVRTTLNFIAQPDADSAEFLFYRNPGADSQLHAGELDEELLHGTRIFHFGSLSLTEEPIRSATLAAIDRARETGAFISFDANYRPTLWPNSDAACRQILAVLPQVNLLKVNKTELVLLTGSDNIAEASEALLSQGPDLCIVTLGPDGSYFRLNGAGEHIPGFAVPTVDASGCGDAFVAGVLTQLLILFPDQHNTTRPGQWRDLLTPHHLVHGLRFANAVGALTATQQGVIPTLPMHAKVEEFLKHQAH